MLAGDLYIEVLINMRNLPTSNPRGMSLAGEIKRLKVGGTILCDNEDKTSIHTLRAHNINALPAIKGKGSIIGGIKKLQQFGTIYILNNHYGEDTLTDFANYHRTKTPAGIILDAPADGQEDHTIDAARYALSKTIIT